jgi:hypothetical protein
MQGPHCVGPAMPTFPPAAEPSPPVMAPADELAPVPAFASPARCFETLLRRCRKAATH